MTANLSVRLIICQNGFVALELYQALEVHERVVEGGRDPPAALPAIEQRPETAVIRRICETNVKLGVRRSSFDSKLQTPANRISADERQTVVGDQAVDLVELFFVTRKR